MKVKDELSKCGIAFKLPKDGENNTLSSLIEHLDHGFYAIRDHATKQGANAPFKEEIFFELEEEKVILYHFYKKNITE